MGFIYFVIQNVKNLKKSPRRWERIHFADFSLAVLTSEHLHVSRPRVPKGEGVCVTRHGEQGTCGLNAVIPAIPNQYLPSSPSLGAGSILYPAQYATTPFQTGEVSNSGYDASSYCSLLPVPT